MNGKYLNDKQKSFMKKVFTWSLSCSIILWVVAFLVMYGTPVGTYFLLSGFIVLLAASTTCLFVFTSAVLFENYMEELKE